MEIREVKTKEEKKRFVRFIYELYQGDPHFCDVNVLFVKIFLYRQDSFSRRNKVFPILITEGTEIKLECIFIVDETSEIKLSFLEFVPNAKEYLTRLEQYARELMRTFGKEKVIIGVNGQISYGLGILVNAGDEEFEFNSNYHGEYYTRELDEAFPVRKRAFSYQYDAAHSLSLIDQGTLDRVNHEYQFRFLDVRHFKREMLLLGKLCHESLKSTPYYAEKTPLEMYELMKNVKFIMKREDVIFAMKDGREIGFIYVHPDYAELFDRPRLNYVKFYLRFLRRNPGKVIYNVIGVLPEHQATGVAVALIHRSILLRKDQYPSGVSSFILEENVPSNKLCKKLSTGINKEFHLYEIWREDNDVSKD